ncbi:MAG: hypothetical protein LBK70_00395 [Clostridiales bacterium]|jgi:hypothetical protein|nr:hypothetical protein [Clostridiales bacterium]
MNEFVEKYIVPLVLGGGSVITIALIVLPMLLRYIGKLKRAIQGKDNEIARLKGIESTLAVVQSNLDEIKAKQDYGTIIKEEINSSIANMLSLPLDIQTRAMADMCRQSSVTHDTVEKIRQACMVTWGSNPKGGDMVKNILAEPVTHTVLYKRELETAKLKDLVRQKYGADAEGVLASVVAEVENG